MEFLTVRDLTWTVIVFLAFGFSVCLHEFGHAIVAYWGGDRSVKDKGYLTLNPLRYTHATNSIVLPFIFLMMGGLPLPGAAVYINMGALRGPKWKSAVSAAGPLATAFVALIIATLITLLPFPSELNVISQNNLLAQGLALLLTLEIAGVCLNLIPIPGLDGYGILEPWLPITWQNKLRQYAKYGVWILFAAFWLAPGFNQSFWGVVRFFVQQCGVPENITALSFIRFQQGARLIFFVLLMGWVGYSQWKKRQPNPKTLEQKTVLTSDQLEEKLERIKTQIKLHPSVDLFLQQASVLTSLRRYKEATECLSKAVTTQPNPEPETYLRILHTKSHIAFYQQNYEDALTLLDKILAIDTKNNHAFYNKACCHAQLGQIEAGIAALTNALSTHTTDLKQQAQNDEDLLPLRSHPQYPSLISS